MNDLDLCLEVAKVNWKWHMGYQMVTWRPMTLPDPKGAVWQYGRLS